MKRTRFLTQARGMHDPADGVLMGPGDPELAILRGPGNTVSVDRVPADHHDVNACLGQASSHDLQHPI